MEGLARVIINPGGDIGYKSFYILGLERLFGRNNIVYDSCPFIDLPIELKNGKDILFVIEKSGQQKRYYISCDDSYQIKDTIWQWTDVYGGVNVNWVKTDKKYWPKMVSLCPSFGIKCWNPIEAIFYSFQNHNAGFGTLRHCFGRHWRMMQRMPYDEYASIQPTQSDRNNIFFLSTLWYNDEWNQNDRGVNLARANFIRAAQKVMPTIGGTFEGGFASQGADRSSENEFADCLYHSVPIKEWFVKTAQSALVFNTPAFWDCHGWKLGEYMAMGACVLSTKLSNDLPAPLNHGEHIHIVENSQEAMEDAIRYILMHPEYNNKLRQNLRNYWQKYGTPEASLRLLGVTND